MFPVAFGLGNVALVLVEDDLYVERQFAGDVLEDEIEVCVVEGAVVEDVLTNLFTKSTVSDYNPNKRSYTETMLTHIMFQPL